MAFTKALEYGNRSCYPVARPSLLVNSMLSLMDRAIVLIHVEYVFHSLAVFFSGGQVDSNSDPLEHLVLGLYLPNGVGIEAIPVEGNLTLLNQKFLRKRGRNLTVPARRVLYNLLSLPVRFGAGFTGAVDARSTKPPEDSFAEAPTKGELLSTFAFEDGTPRTPIFFESEKDKPLSASTLKDDAL